MASIIKANINLNEIPKDKIYKGKKGSYLPLGSPWSVARRGNKYI